LKTYHAYKALAQKDKHLKTTSAAPFTCWITHTLLLGRKGKYIKAPTATLPKTLLMGAFFASLDLILHTT
jgi:hypothetical protein